MCQREEHSHQSTIRKNMQSIIMPQIETDKPSPPINEKETVMLYHQLEGNTSPYIRRDSYRNEKLLLTPIAEVRRVTFAARYVPDEEEEGAYTPVDVVRVKFIPHLSEFTKSELCDTWYTNEEIKEMKRRAFRDVDCRREEIRSNKKRPAHKQSGYSCDIRGLERLVYNDYNVCATIRRQSLRALFQEQYQQRSWMYGVNNPGGIIHPGDDYLDDERIRDVVMAMGETILSQEIAIRLAREDEEVANEYLERRASVIKEEYRDDRDTTASCETANQPQRQQQSHYQEKMLSPMMERKKRTPGKSSKDCCWCVDVVEVVGRSLILHALLRPFLEMRRGDILMD